MLIAYKKFWKNFKQFDGKSSRSDYWWAFLVNTLIRALIILSGTFMQVAQMMARVDTHTSKNLSDQVQTAMDYVIAHPTFSVQILQGIGIVFSLVIMIPVTTLTARRLQDIGISGALAYALPAIYLLNAASELVPTNAVAAVLVNFGRLYAFFLLIMCIRKSDSVRPREQF